MSQVSHLKSFQRAIISWSGGKDSAMAFWKVQQEKKFEICGLLTTVSLPYNRISMHGVRRDLLESQANALGLPLIVAEVSEKTNEAYEEVMLDKFGKLKREGITHIVFGDIFLDDLRLYREELLAKVGLKCIFPLWKQNTIELAKEFIDSCFKTITCCVNDEFLGKKDCGKEFTKNFIEELPANVDPCGENGEFHTFCYAGPIFKKKISITIGEKVYRPLDMKTTDKIISTKGFWYCDLLLSEK